MAPASTPATSAGASALLAATQRNRVEVARFLIQEGADVNAKDFVQDSVARISTPRRRGASKS